MSIMTYDKVDSMNSTFHYDCKNYFSIKIHFVKYILNDNRWFFSNFKFRKLISRSS